MKFNKQINNGTLLIPGGAFKISGFEGGEKVEIHTLDSAVVVLKKQMTTMELIQAMDALHRLATELTVHLARVCGTCDDCEDGCPFDDLEDGMLELPDYLDAFISQVREAYGKLELFGPEHCEPNSYESLDYEGRVLVLSPDTLKESCWTPQNQLWLAHDGFGCSPHAVGRSIRCTCLGDGEQTRWNRTDFTGVLKEEFLPGWAREKLEEFQGQNAGMGGMEMT